MVMFWLTLRAPSVSLALDSSTARLASGRHPGAARLCAERGDHWWFVSGALRDGPRMLRFAPLRGDGGGRATAPITFCYKTGLMRRQRAEKAPFRAERPRRKPLIHLAPEGRES